MSKEYGKGIRMIGEKYFVSIELPPRKDRVERSYSFHVGSTENLEVATELRDKAYKMKTECENAETLLECLQELKYDFKNRNFFSKTKAIGVINNMLFELENDKESTDYFEKKSALELAIKSLR